MKKKIFAVADIHGHYNILKKSLDEAGYDENNPNHLLIVLGDHFDRGEESLSVYEYLKRLSDENKAIVLKGNHDNMFIDYLMGTKISPFDYFHNGENATFAEFLHQTRPFETWCLLYNNIEEPTTQDFANWLSEAREEINNEYPELLEWMQNMPYYYETSNYIFTHASIDTAVSDWHFPHCYNGKYTDWDALLWDDGSFFGKYLTNTNKKVVIGHFGTDHLRRKYNYRSESEEDDFSILTREDGRVIAIDATTVYSKKINVLVIESEDLIDE